MKHRFIKVAMFAAMSAAVFDCGGLPANGQTITANVPTGEASLAHVLSTWTPMSSPTQDPIVKPCTDRIDLLAVPAVGRETSRFGIRSDPLGGGWRLHAGIDFAAMQGMPVASAGHGEVLHAGWASGYGNLVIIDHGNGLTTRYAHLLRSLVRVGQDVDSGQAIGLVGATGHATGSHLHFEIRMEDRPLDPDHVAMPCLDIPRLAPRLDEVSARSGWAKPNGDGALPTAIIR